ncbi:tyrosine--tRNA ligase [Candidatus Magnetaquicoccus inordinatus]|uniref:tyrosine--tRNA ligase n=1 Tax=Candidatus Magnetaquicoccus inordinatus TaxID=2496818 RepID=UPI00102BAB51|nr:tyrosine--tRNA ligase [Candidatus Magnetaquicoccus inordinatus]
MSQQQTQRVAEQMRLIRRGVAQLISEAELEEKLTRSLATGVPLRIKAGFDPTAADLHLGHTVLLHKMRQFQELGHEVIFLIGDFTGRIGDPTGKNATRKPLTPEEVTANAQTYQKQVFHILDREKTRVVFNSSWMDKLSAVEMIQLAARYTVARMLEREDFANRYRQGQPIAIHEFLYPLVQGYDSVVLQADLELGGTDQTFNLLVGRELQKDSGQAPQCILTMPILEGLDGVQKMSKSLGNFIAIQDSPDEMFGKMMSLSDPLMWRYYELLSTLDMEQIEERRQQVEAGRFHPMEAKKLLAAELTQRFHGQDAASQARERFEAIFGHKELPSEVETITLASEGGSLGLASALTQCGLLASNSEAFRLIRQQAVAVDGQRISDDRLRLQAGGSYLLQVGKRRFARLVLT